MTTKEEIQTERPFSMIQHGNIVSVTPHTEDAAEWFNSHVDMDFNGEAQVDRTFYVESRYAQTIFDGYYGHEEEDCEYC